MVSKMILQSVIQFLVFFAAAMSAEAHSRSFPQDRFLQRHFSAPGAKEMPANQNATQLVFSPTSTPIASPTNIPTLRPSDVESLIVPTLEPSLSPIASPTPTPTTEPTLAPDAVATTTPPTAEPTRAPDSSSPDTPTAPPVEIAAVEESPNGDLGGTPKARGGFGPGAGTALGAGLLVLIGGVFFYRRRSKKDDEADATVQPTDLEGGSSA